MPTCSLTSTGRPAGLPLFAQPALSDPVLGTRPAAAAHRLVGDADPLVRDERLTATVTAMVGRGTTRPLRVREPEQGGRTRRGARRARALLEEAYAEQIPAEQLAEAAGCSRFALYRAFHAEYGMAPSDCPAAAAAAPGAGAAGGRRFGGGGGGRGRIRGPEPLPPLVRALLRGDSGCVPERHSHRDRSFRIGRLPQGREGAIEAVFAAALIGRTTHGRLDA